MANVVLALDKALRIKADFIACHDKIPEKDVALTNKLMYELLKECRDMKDTKMQAAIENFDQKVGKFSENKENFLDFLTEIGKHLSRTLLLGLGKITRDSCSMMRNDQLDKDIRGPLFSSTEDLIKSKLQNENTQNIPIETQLKYLALLSSIDRKKTENFLKSDPGSRLLPLNNKDIKKAYEDFLQRLFKFSYPQSVHGQPTEKEILAKMVYSNLTLGRRFYEDGGREILPIEKFPMIACGQEKDLVRFLLEIRGAFKEDDSVDYEGKDLKATPNQEVLTVDDISKGNKNPPFIYVNISQGPKSPIWHYISNEWNFSAEEAKIITEKFKLEEKSQRDIVENNKLQEINRQLVGIYQKLGIPPNTSTEGINDTFNDILETAQLHVATKVLPKTVKIEDAERLGQITHSHAMNLKSQGFTRVRLLQTTYRYSTYSSTDKKNSNENILGKEPEIFKKAKDFGQLIIDKNNKQNENDKKSEKEKIAITPIFCGFCMGGMSAQSVGIDCGYPSFTINAFSKGKGIRRSIGKAKFEEANNDENSLCHQSIYIAGDEISDERALQNTLKNKKKARGENAQSKNKTVEERINNSINDIGDAIESTKSAFVYNSRDGQTYFIDRLPADVALKRPAARHSSYVNIAKNIVLELLRQTNPESDNHIV